MKFSAKAEKRISSEDKKRKIPLKSLNGSELSIDLDDGYCVSCHTRFNNHRINITYYRELPEYSESDPVRITKRCIVHNWYYLNSYNNIVAYGIERELSEEIIQIFDEMLDIG